MREGGERDGDNGLVSSEADVEHVFFVGGERDDVYDMDPCHVLVILSPSIFRIWRFRGQE